MRKYWLLFGFLACVLIFASGCSKNSQAGKNNFTDKNFGSPSSTERFNLSNFTTSTIAELKMGDKIVVTGVGNSDGSINATRIMVGDLPRGNGDFNTSTRSFHKNNINQNQTNNQPEMGDNMEPPQNDGSNQMPPSDASGQGNFSEGGRPNFQGDSNRSGRQASGAMRDSMIIGEILSKSDNNLVVKMVDGGSKIIFFSSETKILKFNPASVVSSTPKNDNGIKN